jgi:hypothetical protein
MNHDTQGTERLTCGVLVIGGGPTGPAISPMPTPKSHRVVPQEADAPGRDTCLASRFKCKERRPNHNGAADHAVAVACSP